MKYGQYYRQNTHPDFSEVSVQYLQCCVVLPISNNSLIVQSSCVIVSVKFCLTKLFCLLVLFVCRSFYLLPNMSFEPS